MDDIRVRFAPSPTGFLHVGGARTALYSWLFARRNGGKFLVRIEDTDRKRFEAEWVDAIIDGLKWLGLTSDEPLIFQSQRLDIYNEHFDKLLADGRAYKCFCTTETLDAQRKAAEAEKRDFRYDGRCRTLTAEQIADFESDGRKSVLRFVMPQEESVIEDLTFGTVRKQAGELDDFIIRKSDGFPTYHFAVVVDDALMSITHVIRGKEHLENTHKHQALQNALGFPRPTYCHLPILLNPDNSKLSKRKDTPEFWAKGFPRIRTADYKAAGYLPEALVNYLALLGWSPGDDREIMTQDELIAAFSLDRVIKSDAKWSTEKLDWMNGQYIMAADVESLLKRLREYLNTTDVPAKAATDDQLAALLPLYRERMRTLADFGEKTRFFFIADEAIEFDPKAVKKVINKDGTLDRLREIVAKIEQIEEWTAETIDRMIHDLSTATDVGMGKYAQPIRVAVTGTMGSPVIGETLEVLGKETTLARIRRTLDVFAGTGKEHE